MVRHLGARVVAALLLGAAACGGGEAGADRSEEPERRTTPLEDHVDDLTPFVLEEDDASVVVEPAVRVGPDGGFLMADRAEHQVRYYGPDGGLRWRFGQEGRGPTDLLGPLRALWMADSTLFVVSQHASDALWEAGGHDVRYTLPRRSVRYPEDAAVFEDSLVAIGTMARFRADTTFRDSLVEVVRARDGAVVRSMFLPNVEGIPLWGVSLLGHALVAARGDTLATLFSVGRAVHFLDRAGRTLDTVPVPYVRFVDPPQMTREDVMAQALDSTLDVSQAQELHWLSDGSFLVSLMDRREGPGEPDWHVLRFDRAGRFLFESPGQLRAVDPTRLRIWVQDPARLEPNRWLAGDLRPAAPR